MNDLKIKATVKITPQEVTVDGKHIAVEGEGSRLLTDLYRKYVGDYPKFFKMDALSRLGFIATELLLGDKAARDHDCEDVAVVLFNHSSSICDDRHYQKTIVPENFFPSPSVFVYTLPNIVTGEIAIRNKFYGETSFYLLPHRDDRIMAEVIDTSFLDPVTKRVIGGWLDCESDELFEAELSIFEKSK